MACELHPGAATSWSVPIPTTLAIAAAVLLYLRGWRLLRRSSPEVATGHRSWPFVGGMLVLWVVVGSPLSALDHALLTFHMVQHLLLMTVAAPLILLGTPGVAFVRGVPGLIRRAAGMFLRSAAVRRIGRSLTHPVSCWVAGTAVVVAWHVPAAHELGMRWHWWHGIQQASFFAVGLLFWWPVDPTGHGMCQRAPDPPNCGGTKEHPCGPADEPRHAANERDTRGSQQDDRCRAQLQCVAPRFRSPVSVSRDLAVRRFPRFSPSAVAS